MSHEWVFDFQSSPTGRVWYTCKKCDASACTDVGEGTEHLLPKACVAVGHRDLRMLQAYYNESAEDIAKKLK